MNKVSIKFGGSYNYGGEAFTKALKEALESYEYEVEWIEYAYHGQGAAFFINDELVDYDNKGEELYDEVMRIIDQVEEEYDAGEIEE